MKGTEYASSLIFIETNFCLRSVNYCLTVWQTKFTVSWRNNQLISCLTYFFYIKSFVFANMIVVLFWHGFVLFFYKSNCFVRCLWPNIQVYFLSIGHAPTVDVTSRMSLKEPNSWIINRLYRLCQTTQYFMKKEIP